MRPGSPKRTQICYRSRRRVEVGWEHVKTGMSVEINGGLYLTSVVLNRFSRVTVGRVSTHDASSSPRLSAGIAAVIVQHGNAERSNAIAALIFADVRR